MMLSRPAAVGSGGVSLASHVTPSRRFENTWFSCDARLAKLMAVTTLRTAVARRADHFDVIDPTTDAYLLVLAEIEELTLTTH